MLPQIIYEDKDFLAVNKPAGLLVHSVLKVKSKNPALPADRQKPNDKQLTLVDWLIKYYPEIKNVGDQPEIRPGIVHRLDKDTSGVMIIARHQKYFEYLKNLFKNHQIKKTYLALVWGKLEPKKGIIEKPIRFKRGTMKRTVWEGKNEKPAITEYKVKKYFHFNNQEYSLVELSPKTGRTHQIRVHLAALSHPIVGDSLYGFKKLNQVFNKSFNLNRLFLHAQSLEFSREDGKRIKLEADLPEELSQIIDTFRFKR